ncbi:DUF6233 domain-containing protein [Streptomyces canus]
MDHRTGEASPSSHPNAESPDFGTGRPSVQVHAGTCHMIGSRRRPVSRDEARRLMTEGLRACTHCQPDTQLHIIDLVGVFFFSTLQVRTGGYAGRTGDHGRARLDLSATSYQGSPRTRTWDEARDRHGGG